MIESIVEYQFLQNAITASILASIICGIMGVIIMERKLVMMSGGIAHASYGGIGLGYYLGIEPIYGAFLFSICASLGVGFIHKRTPSSPDILIGLFWSMGMAVGILLIAFTPGYPPDITSYLFGDILTVQRAELPLLIGLTLVIVLTIMIFFNYWKAFLFDEEFVFVKGVNTTIFEYVLFLLIAMSVVVLIRVVGIILVLALFSAPPALARMFTADFKNLIFLAIIIGAFFCISGLWISYHIEIPSGAVIVLLSGISYFTASLVKMSLYKNRSQKLNSYES